MYKLEIRLKQHTPLLHFQHDQCGATLRASEVKPRLDRFLIGKLRESGGYNEGVQTGWLKKKNDRDWLDYKMKFYSPLKEDSICLENKKKYDKGKIKYETVSFPFLLANMGGKDSEEDLVNLVFLQTKQVDMEIHTANTNLYEIIKKNIVLFFALHNFGQRQDKGFGSFTVDRINGESKGFPKELLPNGTTFLKYSYPNNAIISNKKKQKQLFQIIDFYWKVLKTGVNYTQYDKTTRKYKFPKRYIKAYLWKYLNDNGKTWEKRVVKETFGLTTDTERERPDNPNAVSFARALLGCPDKFEYRNKDKTVDIKHSESQTSDNFIARIPSPIVFKPVISKGETIVYILFDNSAIEHLKKLKNLTFTFVCGSDSKSIDIDPYIIDLHKLIDLYSEYIQNEVRIKAFENDDKLNNYANLHKISKDTTWFLPLDFNWRSIFCWEEYNVSTNKKETHDGWVELHRLN